MPGARAGSSIAAVSFISGLASLVLPLFALPALVGTIQVESTLRKVGLYGLGLCAVGVAAAVLILTVDHPLHWLGRTLDRVKGVVLRHPSRHPDIADRLLAERDIVRRVLGGHWHRAALAAAGQRGFDFLALVLAVYATGARPNLFLVLLAYAVSQILVVVPITPGGLGFVEVGLVGFLRFAGLDPAAALGATLAYRLFSYWLPLPVGAAALRPVRAPLPPQGVAGGRVRGAAGRGGLRLRRRRCRGRRRDRGCECRRGGWGCARRA